MVGVEMGEEDEVDVDEPRVGAEQLPLGSFPAVHEHALATTTNEGRRGSATCGRRRRCRAEEDEIEVHGGRWYRR